MGLSIFLAKWLGLYMLIVAAGWIFRKEQIDSMSKEIIASKSFIILSGWMQILIGLAILIGHPIWQFSWVGLITLLGLISVLRGIAHIFWTEGVQRHLPSLMSRGYWGMIAFLVVVGAILTYSGFMG